MLAAELRLLAAAAEDERVAALDARDDLALLGVGQQQAVRLFLGYLLAAADLADVEQQRIGARAVQRGRRDELVIQDDIGLCDDLQRPHGHEARVAGAGADEDDAAVVHVIAISAARASSSRAPIDSRRVTINGAGSSATTLSRSHALPSGSPTNACSAVPS